MKRTDDEVRTEVRTAYASVATAAPGACAPGCCGPNPVASSALGYSEAELAALPDGANLGLGCGNPQALASLKAGELVIDLGAGGGMDAFLAARQVGPTGRVIGVDMTPEMVTRARANAARANVANVEFRLGEIEALPVADGVADVIMSNCVINLSPDKPRVLREAFRVLKAGGRLAISDIVELAPMPSEMRTDAAALVGCIGGAAPVAALEQWLREAGFTDVAVTVRPESRAFIAEWLPGSGAENYVASASIVARRPGGACCAPGC